MEGRRRKRTALWVTAFAVLMGIGADVWAGEWEETAQGTDRECENDKLMQSEIEGEAETAGKTGVLERGVGNGWGTDTVRVTLPTSSAVSFDFIMDPQQLISGTDAAAYKGKTFQEDATVFFRRFDGESDEDYSSLSDALTVTNMGAEDIEVVMTANVCLDFADGIVMTDDEDFTNDTDTSFYLALTDGNVTVPVTGREGASISVTLEGYQRRDGEYSCGRFRLLGAVNQKGDWSEIPDAVPEVTVTWDIVSADTEWLRETMETEKVSDAEKDNGPGETKGLTEEAGAEAETEKEDTGEKEAGAETEAAGEAGEETETETAGEVGEEMETETAGEAGEEMEIETAGEMGEETGTETAGEAGEETETETAGTAEKSEKTESGRAI